MMNLNFDPFPELRTERLLLRKIDISDGEDIFFLRSDEMVMKYIDRAPAQTLNDAYEYIDKINELEKSNEAVTWGITVRDISKLIGTICYWNIQKEHYRAEIGYVLHPDFWGKGIMQEAVTIVLRYGLNVMKLHSVEAQVNPLNLASIKLLERNNFKREAYFKENYFYKGNFLDTAVYSLIPGLK